jgi:hypothetical protein
MERCQFNDCIWEILEMKINGERNDVIGAYVRDKYGVNYNDNYISTLFTKSISKKVAKGAILNARRKFKDTKKRICPKCKEKYTISTSGHDVVCSSCGMKATLDDRYSFVNAEPFENFADWYEWQKEEIFRSFSEDEGYALTSLVELKFPSTDGKSFLYSAGHGVATLTREGLTYVGTIDGEQTSLSFAKKDIYRLLFGAGESFEIYVGQKIHFFLPKNGQTAVDWYIASEVIAKL